MKEKIVNKTLLFITHNKNYDEVKIKTIKYGLNGLYSLITKTVVVAIITILLNSFIEYILLLLAYMFIRRYSFGLHASKSSICWIFTILIYVGGSLIIKYFTINRYLALGIWIFSFISFILWAPADTPKRPLIREKQRKVQKIKTIIICIVYLALMLLINNKLIINTLSLTLLVQSIMINPLIYKITNTPFNNYRFYLNKV